MTTNSPNPVDGDVQALNELVAAFYPQYGTPGSRDVDITARRKVIDQSAAAIAEAFRELQQEKSRLEDIARHANRGWKHAYETTKRAEAAEAEVQRLNATAQPLSCAANDVLAERQRQQMIEGWTTKHDDQYQFNELAIAGGLYALNAHDSSPAHFKSPPNHWPWNAEWWKPKSPRKDLVRAAALIIAEIERIDRLSAAPGGQ